MMIRAATTPDGQRHERKLFDELGFALDGFMVLSQPAEQSNFASLSLAEQIAGVLPEATRNGAMVVVWLSFPLPNQVMLNLVAIGSGRALVRTIETSRSPITETTLALMAKELLGTAYLFEQPKDVPIELRAVVKSVKEQIPVEPAAPAAPLPVPPPSSSWAAWVRGAADYPLAGAADAVPVWRVGLAIERRLPLELDGSLAATGAYGSVSRPTTPGGQMWAAGLAATLYRGFETRVVSCGPYASAGASYASFRGSAPAFSSVLPSFELGVQGRSESPTGVAVAAQLGVAYDPVQAELRAGDGQLLFRTPSLAMMLGVSVGWRGL
jgi:hypothetical protein